VGSLGVGGEGVPDSPILVYGGLSFEDRNRSVARRSTTVSLSRLVMLWIGWSQKIWCVWGV
jgi:hypothetical protein